ncbi:hypothetical protein PBAL39_13387 [Pedobacter sp. BAL39]|uniref:hypothetical protein n=1 Tax=Pedobacter sp. BAL39 TaxID=391596 RepID=UPI000155995F|nr:hypothetical protein [Pedobacter sp. BAL39]EDM35228.1 hypothetical protein PBAL39_13387 [Pedobacter sp. BAL39]
MTLSKSVESGEVKFTKNAIWIFASCNAGNSNDPVWDIGNLNIARNTANLLGIQTIGARGYVGPELINGKDTGRLIAGNSHGSNIQDLGFIKFTPVTITLNMRSLEDIINKRPGKDVTYLLRIKEEKLGLAIDPREFITDK